MILLWFVNNKNSQNDMRKSFKCVYFVNKTLETVKQMPTGLLNRNGATAFNMFALKGQTLDIIVENQGRINYGGQINDNKKV